MKPNIKLACLCILFLGLHTSTTKTFAQSSTCIPGMVENGNNDPWSEECYLNDSCNEQGNPCQANDVNLLGAFLADSSGNPIPICFGNQTIEVYLWGTFMNGTNTDRYAVRSRTEVWLDGMMDTELNSCSFDTLPPGVADLALLGVFSYTCGQQIQLVNTWIGWETSAAICSDPMDPDYIGDCGDYAPSKCSKSIDDTISFLSPNFLYTCGDITMTTTEVCFMNLTTGGTPPLTYSWDFGDGGMSSEENPCHTYMAVSGSFDVILTVTDSMGVDAGALYTINLDSLNCCQLSITCPDTNGGTFACTDEIPMPDPSVVMVLDSCFMVSITTEDDTVGTGCMLDTMFITRNYYITDGVSFDTCYQVFKAVDDVAPDLTGCTNLDTTIECGGPISNEVMADAWHAANLMALLACATDNCTDSFPDALIADDYDFANLSSVCGLSGTLMVTYTVSDSCGNATDFLATLTIVDTTPPDLAACGPYAETVECGMEDLAGWIAGIISNLEGCASDVCDGDLGGQVSAVETSFTAGCGTTGTYVYTFTVTDDCSNTSTITGTYTIEDTTPPDLATCGPYTETVECGMEDLAGWIAGVVSDLEACANDMCDGDLGSQVSAVETSFTAGCGTTGTYVYTFTVTDDCSNSSTITGVYTIQDTTPPDLTACGPYNETVECGNEDLAGWIAGVISDLEGCASDMCDDGLSGQVSAVETSFTAGCGTTGTYVYTFTVTDDCSNTSTITGTYTIEDTTPPDLTACGPYAETVECGMEDLAGWIAGVISDLEGCASDICDDGLGGQVSAVETSFTADCGTTGTYVYTFTVTDDCNNTSTITGTYTIEDTTPPDLTACGPYAETAECGSEDLMSWVAEVILDLEACASDLCDMDLTGQVTAVESGFTGTCGASGFYLYTFTVTDDCNNSSTITGTYTIEDTTPPDLGACGPYMETVECGTEDLDGWIAGVISDLEGCATDICDPDLDTQVTAAQTSFTGDCGTTGTYLYTFTVTDDCDNTSTITGTYTIEDTTPPDLTACGPYADTVECGMEDLAAWISSVVDDLEICASDVCDDNLAGQVTFVQNSFTVDCGTTGTYVYTFTVTDDCGNTSTITGTCTIEDTTPPDVSACPSLDTTLECDADDNASSAANWNATNIALLESCVTDVCDMDLAGQVTSDFDFDNFSFDCGLTGSLTVTYTITDDCGNSSTVTGTITIEDTTAPDLSACGSLDDSVECDEDDNFGAALAWNAANIASLQACAADSCDQDLDVNSDYDFANLMIDCGLTGSITVTYTVTDDCGNSSTITGTFTIEDTTAPDLSNCGPYDATVECDADENLAAAATWHASNLASLETCASDSCDADLLVTSNYDYNNLSQECGLTGTLTVTYTVTDDCGNSSTITATLTIEDTTPPDVTNCGPFDVTSECDADDNMANAAAWNAANIAALETCAADSCDIDLAGQVTSDFSFDNLEQACGITGTLTVTYTVTDDCGNSSTITATFTIQDTTPPDLGNCPPFDATIECDVDDNETAIENWNTTNIGRLEVCAADLCDLDLSGQVTSDYDIDNFVQGCGNTGSVLVTYTVSDDCGNTSTFTATLTIEDTTAPDLGACGPLDSTVECDVDENATAATDWNNANLTALALCAADSCDQDLDIVSDFDLNNLVPGCGNTGAISVTYTVTDDCGNSSTITGTFTIEDTTAPDLSNCGPFDSTVECDADDNQASANAWHASNLLALESCAADSCDTDLTITSDYSFDNLVLNCGITGTLTVTYTVTDDCGNSSTVTGTFTIEDTTAPDLTNCGPFDATVECDADDNATAAASWHAANLAALEMCVADSCDNDFTGQVTSNYSFDNLVLDCGITGTLTVTYTVTDDCGNSSTITATFTIVDTTAPDLTNCGPFDATVECDLDDNETAIETWNSTNIGRLEVCASDSCDANLTGQVTSDYDIDNFISDCGNAGSITVTYTVTDDCGNSSTITSTFTIEDTTAPDLSSCGPFDTTIECNADANDGNAAAWNTANLSALETCAADSCDTELNVSSNYNFANLVSACGATGQLTVTYTVTDDCGNSSSISATLTIEDNTPPSITCPADTTVQCSPDVPAPDIGSVTASDACSDVTVTHVGDVSDGGSCPETITRTYRATDACGNSSTCIQIITVNDTIPPTFSGPGDVTIDCEDDFQDLALTGNISNPNDNCTAVADLDTTITDDLTNMDGCNGTGFVIRTFVLADACGNLSSQTQRIDIIDIEPPVFILPPDTVINCEEDYTDLTVTGDVEVTGDNCSMFMIDTVIVSDELDLNGCNNTGTVTRTFVVTDLCGNSAMGTQVITIQDTTPPTAQCMDITVDFMGENYFILTPDMVNNGSFDNCSDPSLSIDIDSLTCDVYPEGYADVLLTVTDGCGLTDTCTSRVFFENASDIMVDCPDTMFYYALSGECEVMIEYEVNFFDICGGGVTIEQIDSSGYTSGDLVPIDTCFYQIYIAYNEVGDTARCTFVIKTFENPGNGQFACKNEVNVSLDQNCQIVVTPTLLLAGSSYGCLENYIVTPKDDTVELINGNIIDGTFVGQSIALMLTDLETGNRCWTLLNIEDKIGPALDCGRDTIYCYEDRGPSNTGFPVPDTATIIPTGDGTYVLPFQETCGPIDLEYFDATTYLPCGNAFAERIIRHWSATDAFGNTSSCNDTILVRRVGLDAVILPPHFDGMDEEPLECGSNCVSGDGTPKVSCTGEPSGDLCENIYFDYSDTRTQFCGGSYTVNRTWRIFDFCTGNKRHFIQRIKVLDREPPQVTCLDTFTVSTGPWVCTATVELPIPEITDACSETSLKVFSPLGPVPEVNGKFILSDIGVGHHIIIYQVNDECYNPTSCEMILEVVDESLPVVVCDQHTIVGITEEDTYGLSLVDAVDLAADSYDACGPVTVYGRRMDSCIDFDWTTLGAGEDRTPDGFVTETDLGTVFRKKIPFACCDVNNSVMVELMVVDASGNTNTCMVEVTAQDKVAPSLIGPPDITLECGYAFDESVLEDLADRTFGTVLDGTVFDDSDREMIEMAGQVWGMDGIARDACGLTLTLEVFDLRDDCGQGNIERVFTAFDGNGSDSYTQIIHFSNSDPFYINPLDPNDPDDDVIWPRDTTITGTCGVMPLISGEPRLIDDFCDLATFTFEDAVFGDIEGACAKVVRTWKVIDWCQYNGSGAGYWEYDQVIKIFNTEGPEGLICADRILCQDDPEVTEPAGSPCTANVVLAQSVLDDCTEAEEIEWWYRVDLNDDGSFEIESAVYTGGEGGAVIDTAGVLHMEAVLNGLAFNDPGNPADAHRIEWGFRDHCSVESFCSYTFRLEDCKVPSAVCQAISGNLMQTGELEIWASDFNASSSDNCTPPEGLLFSFSGDSYVPSMIIDCADAEQQQSNVIPITMYVWDAWGNTDFCTTSFTIDNLEDVCGPDISMIAGDIQTERTDPVAKVDVTLSLANGTMQYLTVEDGHFTFDQLPLYESYGIRPERNDNHRNGVSTLDLVRIQQHILGIRLLETPYKMIAADVNNSQSISAIDLLDLRKLVLGIYDELPNNTSWRFVDKEFEFVDPFKPWPFAEDIFINPLEEPAMESDFVGVKIGDVNGTVVANANQVEIRSVAEAMLHVKNAYLKAGETYRVPVYLVDDANINGLQVEFNVEGASQVIARGAAIEIKDENQYAAGDRLRMSWNSFKAEEVEANTVLFDLEIVVSEDGWLSDILGISTEWMQAELYSEQELGGEISTVDLGLKFVKSADEQVFALYQNEPNPWSDRTEIRFLVPEKMTVQFTIFDQSGRLVYEREIAADAGLNAFDLGHDIFDTGGMMYFRLEADQFVATKKMMVFK